MVPPERGSDGRVSHITVFARAGLMMAGAYFFLRGGPRQEMTGHTVGIRRHTLDRWVAGSHPRNTHLLHRGEWSHPREPRSAVQMLSDRHGDEIHETCNECCVLGFEKARRQPFFVHLLHSVGHAQYRHRVQIQPHLDGG